MAWFDYKKAYEMVPHSWILESLGLAQASDNILKFVKLSMANWETELRFFRVTVYHIYFLICMSKMYEHKAKARYNLGGGEKINHLLFMDYLKLYGKSESKI